MTFREKKMIHIFKAFGLALVFALASIALVAQVASAIPLTTVASGTLWLTGDQDGGTHTFQSAGGSVTCTEVHFLGSGAVGSGAVNEITLEPVYNTEKAGGGNNCTAFGFASTHVKGNGCTYTFTTPGEFNATDVRWSGPSQFHLVCGTGKSIEITPTIFGTSVCTQFVAPQTPTNGNVIGKNVAGSNPLDITLEYALTQIHYTGTGSSCGNSETHSDAVLVGNSTVKCFLDAPRTTRTSCTFS
jgi:hypothetical protein